MDRMMTTSVLKVLFFTSITLTAIPVNANPTPNIISEYNEAVVGDGVKVESAYQSLVQLIEQQGAKPLSLVYLGSTQTLQGREAFLPWKKMKYTEQGLATIDKGLSMLDTLPLDVDQQQRIQGLPEGYLSQAMAAVTYTLLPTMFNHFDRGYDLYLTLLSEPIFIQQPFGATAWVYRDAIQAALQAGDMSQAQQWLAVMQQFDSHHSETQTAMALIAKQS